MKDDPNAIISIFSLVVALFCLFAETACAIWAPNCSSAIQHPSDVLMGGCLGIIMGSVKNKGT